jgi:signal transduction histidine kinase
MKRSTAITEFSDRIFERGRDAGAGLTLRPLMLGLAALFVLGVLAVTGAIWLAGGQADRLAAADKVRQVQRALETRAESLKTTSTDWAWWNEGIDKLVLAPDRVYADQNLGAYGANTLALYATAVVDPDDQPTFAYLRGRPLPSSTSADWLPALRPLIDRTRAESLAQPTPATAYMLMGEQLVFVSATAMAAEAGSPPVNWKRPAVLVFMRAVDAEYLSAIADSAGVSALRSGDIATAAGSQFSLPGPSGAPVAVLVWRFQPPSAVILARLWPAGLLIIVVMLGTGGFMTHRLLRMTARYQREREFREAQLSTAMLEAREADHAKSQFLAAMSHEIRTPLNAVIGYSEMLQLGFGGPLTAKQREYLADIERAGRYQLALLQDILDLSKIEAGRDELDESEVALDAIVEEARAMTSPRALEHGVAIVVAPAPSVTLRADERRLLQMLLNLLANAVRHAPKDSSVHVGWDVGKDGGTALTVSDSGPGIREENLARVLEPFHRQIDSMVSGEESTGLGLPLTARLMALHGGRLHLSNAPTGGLIAKLEFPPARTIRRDDAASGHNARADIRESRAAG